MVSSRNEELMTALINGEDVKDYIPRSRNEQFLKDCAVGSETTTLEPRSRSEMLLSEVHNKIKSGSGFDIDLKSVFDQTKSAKYFFSGYNNKYNLFHYIKDLSNLIKYEDTSNVTSMDRMFWQCSSLTMIPKMDTSNVTNMSTMFASCYDLTTVPQMNTSNVTNMSSMFSSCSSLTMIPNMDTSKVTNMGNMFSGCSSLTSAPQINTSNVTDMHYMFMGCSRLTSAPQMDTSNVTNMDYMFYNCSSLTTVPNMNISNVTSMSSMFVSCSKLEYINLLNIKVNIQIGSGNSWGHLIQKDCLIQIISELIKPESGTKTLTMGTANTAKLADTYVKLLEDDGTGKYPFELCESTVEGAMTITDYCLYKNWQLA